MLIFTNDDYRRIQAWLKANSVKDSELPHFTSENGSEKIAILQDGKNVLITLNELKQLIGGIVRVLTPPTISNVNNKVVIDAKIGTIYYTVGTDHYPHLDSNGDPIDNNTKEYDKPFDINENVTVRAIAKYINSEGEILQSSITEELVYLQKEIDIPTPNNNLTYKGEEQTGFTNLDTSEDSPYTISGVIKATNAGEYEAIFTLKNTAETKWKDREEGISEVKVPWSISKKQTEIKWTVSTEYKVGDTIPAATSSDSFNVEYYRDGILIDLPYVVKDGDIGPLSITAKNILSEDDKKNYIEKSVTKTFTIKEQSIPWQYGLFSGSELLSIKNGLNVPEGENWFNYITYNHLKTYSSNFTTYEGTEIINIIGTSERGYVVLSYPSNTNKEWVLKDSTTGTPFDTTTAYKGSNITDNIKIKVYQLGASDAKLYKE